MYPGFGIIHSDSGQRMSFDVTKRHLGDYQFKGKLINLNHLTFVVCPFIVFPLSVFSLFPFLVHSEVVVSSGETFRVRRSKDPL